MAETDEFNVEDQLNYEAEVGEGDGKKNKDIFWEWYAWGWCYRRRVERYG